MNAAVLASAAGALLSLLFSYVPGLKEWFETLDGTRKRLVMLALLALAAGGAFGLACAGYGEAFGISLACSEPGAMELVKAFLGAIAANQGVYQLSPRAEK